MGTHCDRMAQCTHLNRDDMRLEKAVSQMKAAEYRAEQQRVRADTLARIIAQQDTEIRLLRRQIANTPTERISIDPQCRGGEVDSLSSYEPQPAPWC